MTEERFEEFLKNALDEMDPVPAPPREAMWAQIDQARRFSRNAERKTSRRVWLNWGVGLAAMLAVGIGIGRMTALQQAGAPTQPQTAAVTNVTPNRTTYQVAVSQHLSRAEALLTSFRTQPETATPDPQLALFARDLLTSTQLLLDSPAGDDPKVAALLSDLELILAQIARASATSGDEREIIEDGLNRTAVLPRLRATTAGTAAAGT
ncbi:MAG TPA: hypothetical protein VGC44_09580 [Longimicrobiales bacterium]